MKSLEEMNYNEMLAELKRVKEILASVESYYLQKDLVYIVKEV